MEITDYLVGFCISFIVIFRLRMQLFHYLSIVLELLIVHRSRSRSAYIRNSENK